MKLLSLKRFLSLLPLLWLALTGTPSPAPASTPAAAWQTIFSGGLQNNWQYWGWTTTNLACPAPALSKDSLQVQAAPYQALYLHHAAQQTNARMYLSFWVNGGTSGGQVLTVSALRSGVPQTPDVLAPLKAGQWKRVLIALSTLSVGSVSDLTGFWIQNNSGATLPLFYVDQVVLATAAASPPSPLLLTAPTNLSVQGLWQAGAGPADTLSWSPVPGAASYTVYQYGVQIASGLKTPFAPVLPNAFCAELTYTVTAVDSMGMESLPSAPAEAQGMPDPAQQPQWIPSSPAVPSLLTATSEWNAGAARIHLQWKGDGTDFTYTVYRDGTEVARGLWGLNYIDAQVQPGETHTYTVSGVNVSWTQSIESAQSVPVTATALTAAPALLTVPVQITGIQADDDSAQISFAPVPGAADYRVYDAATPNNVKYSGGSLSIQMNGLDPAVSHTLIVEALDKLGPFQTMDGMAGPGAMQMDGVHVGINGQGDPSNVPNILAVSAPQGVTLSPTVLTGNQVFSDNFRAEMPLATLPLPPAVPNDGACGYGLAGSYLAVANDKWEFRDYAGDLTDTRVFFMGDHFMDTLYDGGTPHGQDPLHTENTSLVMVPKATADISGGKVLHVTFEVDPHMDPRRWCDVFVGAAGDTLTDPGKFADFPGRRPTVSGRLFRWEIMNNDHALEVFPGIKPDAQSDAVYLTNETSGVGPDSFGICARSGPWCSVDFNGTNGDLDKRHKFDLYLSASRAVIMEQGRVVKDAAFPPGVTLPFTKCQVYFVHQVYHTNNDRPELEAGGTDDSYWYNYRPFGDERHWDNCGESVLDAFPPLPAP